MAQTNRRKAGRRPPSLPAFVAPQLASLADAAPAGEKWLYEIKYDGYRVLTRIDARCPALHAQRQGLDRGAPAARSRPSEAGPEARLARRRDRRGRRAWSLQPSRRCRTRSRWRDVARLVRALFGEVELASFLKTTGGRGLHVVVPLARRHGRDEVKSFARAVAEHLARTFPHRFTSKAAKDRRAGKIFVDYLCNGESVTAADAFSVRARAGAPVSMPIPWEALASDVCGAHFNLRNVPERLARHAADPWRDYWRSAGRIARAMLQAVGG